MADKAFTLPNGAKVRTTSKRRFVLIRTDEDKGVASASVIMRSDKVDTLRTDARRRDHRHGSSAALGLWFIGDTVTGNLAQLRAGIW